MIYFNLLEKIISEGTLVERELPIISLYNYNLSLNNVELNNLLNLIPDNRKEKFKTEFKLFLDGEIEVKKYQEKNINYWNYIGDKFINSYPSYYPKFHNIKNNFKEDSKNHVLFLGDGNKSNQQPCMSCIQFQKNNNQLYISMFQRSCDVNLGFLSDIYHLYLFSKGLNIPIKNISILYGNLHLYKNNLSETKRYIRENGQNNPYKFIQNNLKR